MKNPKLYLIRYVQGSDLLDKFLRTVVLPSPIFMLVRKQVVSKRNPPVILVRTKEQTGTVTVTRSTIIGEERVVQSLVLEDTN